MYLIKKSGNCEFTVPLSEVGPCGPAHERQIGRTGLYHTERQANSCAHSVSFLTSFLTSKLIKIQNNNNKKCWTEGRRGNERKVLCNLHFQEEWGYTLAACGTSFNCPEASALIDHVVPEKTPCERCSFVLLFVSTPSVNRNYMLWECLRLPVVRSSHQNKEQAKHYTLPWRFPKSRCILPTKIMLMKIAR